jgi:Flp pilus assembly protein TadG
MQRPKHNRRGATALLLAVMLIVLFAFLAFSIDLGNVFVTRSQLQNAADAASLAAVQKIAEGYSSTDARSAAVSFASKNEPNNGAVLVTGDVTIGVWNSSTRTFTATSSSPNAVQVVVRRDGTNTASVATTFAQLFGIKTTKVTATSVAYYKTSGSKKNYSFVN